MKYLDFEVLKNLGLLVQIRKKLLTKILVEIKVLNIKKILNNYF